MPTSSSARFVLSFAGCLLLATATRTAAAEPLTVDAARFASLQAAVDALPEEGGIVDVPPGKYELAEPLRIHGGDVHFQGAGPSTHLHNLNTDGAAAIALLPAEPFDRGATGGQRINRWRVQFSDFRLTGNPQSGHGIEALWVNEIFLQGVTVSEHGGDGIHLDHCYEDPRINDCLITYNQAAGLQLLGCHDIVVSANHFEENQDAVRCSDGYNLCMSGNNLDDHLRHGVVIENTYGSVVSGNMIEECQGSAVILDRDCYGDTISANVIAHNGQGVVLPDAHGCTVSANTFTILREVALKIGPESGRITVTGNNFSNSYIGAGAIRRAVDDAAAGGIVLEGTRDLVISGNVFSGLTTKAVALRGAPTRGVVFTGNLLRDVASDHAQLVDSLIANNLIRPAEQR